MSDNNIEYYYNGDDWRLFDPNEYNTVVNLDIKQYEQFDSSKEITLEQVTYYVDKIKNRSF